MISLPQQHRLGALFMQMDVKLISNRMNPHSFTGSIRDLRRSVHHYKIFVAFDALQQFTDVNMGVALRSYLYSIVSDSPLVSPEALRFLDGGAPQLPVRPAAAISDNS